MIISGMIVLLIGLGAPKLCQMPEDSLCVYENGEYSFQSNFDEAIGKHRLSIFKGKSVVLDYYSGRNIHVNYGKNGRFIVVDNQESNFSNCLVVDFPQKNGFNRFIVRQAKDQGMPGFRTQAP